MAKKKEGQLEMEGPGFDEGKIPELEELGREFLNFEKRRKQVKKDDEDLNLRIKAALSKHEKESYRYEGRDLIVNRRETAKVVAKKVKVPRVRKGKKKPEAVTA